MNKAPFQILISFVLFFILNPDSAPAQHKIGSINTEEILDLMPEMTLAKSKLDSIGKSYNAALHDLELRYDNAVKSGENDEADRVQLRLYRFKDAVDSEISAKSDTLFKPIRRRLGQAIYEVSKEGNYDFILDSKYDAIILFISRRTDISPDVKKKLGL